MGGTDIRENPLEVNAGRGRAVRDSILRAVFVGSEEAVLGGLRLVEDVLDHEFHGGSYCRVTSGVRDVWAAATSGMTPEEQGGWASCLLADLISMAPVRLSGFPVPASILPQFEMEFSRILDGLESALPANLNLESDLFLKDLSLCRLDSFPCLAQVVEKNGRIPRKVLLNNLRQEFGVVLSLGFATGFRYAPFFEIHTHTAMPGGFDPVGWEQCYLLVADLLELYPEYAGLVGSSCFYDPALEGVSPDLACLREQQQSGGALLLPTGQNASAEGKYKPTGWLMIWPRTQLLRWARRAKTKRLHRSL